MSRPEIAPTSAAGVNAATTTLERSLRRLRLTSKDRRSILEEVRADLKAAAADGVAPQALIGPDPDAFARQAAAAAGYLPRRGEYGRVLLGGALGALAALVGGYLLLDLVVFPLFASMFDLGGFHPVLGAYAFMSALALAVTLGVLGLLALLLRDRAAARATLARAAVLLPVVATLGVVLVGGAAMDFQAPAYVEVIGRRAALVALLLAGALLAARTWALRSPRAEPSVDASYPG